ncbi:MAG TPA: hypothetical protein VMS02_01890 [Solirubrobacteraceae bacterium]|nr:hypothetical protein [Solirubrobacteraceae bacterium]
MTRPRLLALAGALVAVGVAALSPILPGSHSGSLAVAQAGASEEVLPETDASLPAKEVTMIGATPEEPEAPGTQETWGVGREGSSTVVVRYYVHPGSVETREGTWTLGPTPPGESTTLPAGFKLLTTISGTSAEPSPLAGQMTSRGFGVLAGTNSGGTGGQVLLVRKPGGAFEETSPVPLEGEKEALLAGGQHLFGVARAPLIAPLEEADGDAGALVAPVSEEGLVESQVLHWDGAHWSGEPIEIPAKSAEGFRVLALGASSPTNAWLLARLSANYTTGAVALFRRVQATPEHWKWVPVQLSAGAGDGEAHPLTIPVQGTGAPTEGEPFAVPGSSGNQPAIDTQVLTVTSEGIWIDGVRGDLTTRTPASTTLFFKPEGSAGGSMQASWCKLPAEAPAATPACDHELPEALPLGPSRSIAWADGSRYGQRVITGLPEGVSLRLEGESFKRVLALGGGADDPGATLGAAFTSPSEGWLGYSAMPVHLAPGSQLQPSRLQPWPVSFHRPLVAIAPEPGAPIGSLSSGALAVGEGAVARFKPGEGWLPESLFGPGGRVETKAPLRAVAWPRPNRAYAVGEAGEMWLWRGETGLWERDPATPINFRGNLDAIAFDPNNPARGYAVGRAAVGQGGVLLRYGKTWTEETNLPPQVQGASFNSIAFAGSEAIVAYSKQPDPRRNEFVGGLLVNEGSGWHIDSEAEAVAGAGAVPRAVAGLPDGGAAFVASGPEGQHLFEREAAGVPWQQAPTPLPSSPAGALALFREGGALRAIVTAGSTGLSGGSGTVTPGFPPPLAPAGGLTAGPESGGVLRQTAYGWRDESHELNPVGGQEGSFVFYDLPYRPDPIFAVLVDPTGSQGWAVGGISNPEERIETADVERYPVDGATPLGSGVAPVSSPGSATFAFGGEAQCAAPCSNRERAGAGPPLWLRSALALAGRVGEGGGSRLGAFFDLGPTVTAGTFIGVTPPSIPFADELGSYASIFAGSQVPVYDTMSPDDLDARPAQDGTEASWEAAFAGFPRPFGGEGPPGVEEPARCGATPGCESAYYAVEKEGVWVLVLDDSQHGDVDQSQREWVERRLGAAGNEQKPVIVVANANLGAQVAAHDGEATKLLAALVGEDPDGSGDPEHYVASAYFYDSPEANVQEHLTYDGRQLATFGTGTLGYEQITTVAQGDFHGAKGILLGHVQLPAHASERKPNDEVPVSVQLIPVIGELALEAKDGILLRRSSSALFEGLARRPRAGCRATEAGQPQCSEDQYTPIPSLCVVAGCQTAVLPEYEFESSDKEVGRFVERNTATSELHAVLQNAKGEPIPDEREAGKPPVPQSGLFCAFNAGTTTVTIRAGGLSASLPVTVQAGSVREPCGTVPIKPRPPAEATASPPPPTPPPTTSPNVTPASSTPPPVPLPPPPSPIPAVAARLTPLPRVPPAAPPFFIPLIAPVAPVSFVPPPPVPAANPTPPSGTSAVTSPVEAAQREEEEEEATESVSNQAVAYRGDEHEPAPVYLIGVILLAAFAGASMRGRPRRGRTKLPPVAPATLSGTRAQRRMTGGRGRRS